MDKFIIEKSKSSNVQKTIRFPEDLNAQIENIIKEKNQEAGDSFYSFNRFCSFGL